MILSEYIKTFSSYEESSINSTPLWCNYFIIGNEKFDMSEMTKGYIEDVFLKKYGKCIKTETYIGADYSHFTYFEKVENNDEN